MSNQPKNICVSGMPKISESRYLQNFGVQGKADNLSALDVQEGDGDHYKRWEIQPIEFTHENGLGFIRGNVIKYIMRHDEKNGKEDLEKAKHYIDLLIELEYGES